MHKIVLTGMMLFSGAAAAADSYLCVTDQATGFAFNKATGQWHSATFNAGAKYVVSKHPTGAWDIKELGQSEPFLRCPGGFNGNYLICNDSGYDFRMNSHVLRFQKAYLVGYYPDYGVLPKMPGFPAIEEGGDTPALEIGRCSPL